MAWKLPQTIDELDRLIDDAIDMEGSEYLATLQGFPDEQLQNLFRRLTTAVKTYGKPPRFYQRQINRVQAEIQRRLPERAIADNGE